jgi:hypothetical protein
MRERGGSTARWAAACAALALAGCGGAGMPFSIALSWQLADGRSCADSGALTVAASEGSTALGPSGGFACADGEGGGAVTVDGVPGEATAIDLRALTLSGATLYQGRLPLDAPPQASATVTLYFVQ